MYKIKWKILIVFIVVIIISIGCYYVVLDKKKEIIIFKNINCIEYGDTSINSKKLVKKVTGNIIKYPNINCMIIGNQTLSYKVKQDSNEEIVNLSVEVVDTKKPKIKFREKEINISVHDLFEPEQNIESVLDPVDGSLRYSKKLQKGTYTVVSKVNKDKVGTYKVTIKAKDINGNVASSSFNVSVNKRVQSDNPNEIVPTYIKDILLVNKEYGIPRDFGGNDPTSYSALIKLVEAANEAGYEMPILSGYRSYDTQVSLYSEYIARDGQEAADRYSARPGFSEHQTGLCYDIGAIDNEYGNTPAGKWLQANSASYGFIIRYPKGKEDITGYMYEPWHVRYIGVSDAMKIMQQGISLEEYLNAY